MSYLDNEEWDKRKQAEDALSAILRPPDSTKSSDSVSASDSVSSDDSGSDDNKLVVTDHEIKKYGLIPESEVKDEQAAAPAPDVTVYPPIAEDQPRGLPPALGVASAVYPNLSPPPPEPADIKTDADTGTRYVIDSDTGRAVPHAELATPTDRAAFKPGDVALPRVTATGVAVAPRAKLIDPDPDRNYFELNRADQPVPGFVPGSQNAILNPAAGVVTPDPTQGNLGDEELIRQILAEAPAKGKFAPGFVQSSQNAIVNPAAGVIPPTPKPAYPDRIVSPDEASGKTSVVNAPVANAPVANAPVANAPVANAPVANAPVTPANSTKPTLSSTDPVFAGIPIAGQEQAVPAQPQGDTTGQADYFRKRGDQPITDENDPRLTTVGVGNQRWQVHREAAPYFQGFLSELADQGAPITSAGGWNYRQKVGAKGLSEHSWAGAIDVSQEGRDVVSPQFQKWLQENPGKLQAAEQRWHIYGGERFGDLGHFEYGGVGGEPAQAAAASRYGKLIPEGEVDTAAAVTQPQGADAAQPAGKFVSGRATTFGFHDPEDEGVGSSKLGEINTNDGKLVGIAIPEQALRRQFGSDEAAWRRARVEVVGPDGRHFLMPIVDLGPKDTSRQRGIAADFTHGAAVLLNHDDSNQYQFRIVPDAGPDAKREPGAFIAEQQSLASGKTYQSQTADSVSSRYGKLIPEDQVPPPDATEVAASFQKLADKYRDKDYSNLGTVYKDVDSNTDIPQQVRDNFKAGLQKQMVDQMIQYDGDLQKLAASGPEGKAKAEELAWAKWHDQKGQIIAPGAMSMNPNAVDGLNADSIKDLWSKVQGVHGQLTAALRGDPIQNERDVMRRFFQYAGADTDQKRQEILVKIHSLPSDQQFDYIQKLLPQDTGVFNVPYATEISRAAARLSDAGWMQAHKDEHAKALADASVKLAGDPRMKATFGGNIDNAVSTIVNMGEVGILGPGASFGFLAQAADQEHAKVKAEHPDWTDTQINQEAWKGAAINAFGQELGMKIFGGLLNPLVGGVANPIGRRVANSIISAAGMGGVGISASALTDLAEGKPVDWRGAIESGQQSAIAGGIGGLAHGVPHEAKPEAVPPPLPESKLSESVPLPRPEVKPPEPIAEPHTAAEILGPKPSDESAQTRHGDVLNSVAQNLFPDLTEDQARNIADRASLLSTSNLETDRFKYELQKFLPQDTITNFGPTNRLLQAYARFRDGPTEYTAKEIASAEKAYNEAREYQRPADVPLGFSQTPAEIAQAQAAQQSVPSRAVSPPQTLEQAIAQTKAKAAQDRAAQALGGTPSPSVPPRPGRAQDSATQALRAKQPHIYAVDPSGRENVASIAKNTDGTYRVMMPRQGMHDPNTVYRTAGEAQTGARNAFEKAGWKVSFDPREPSTFPTPAHTAVYRDLVSRGMDEAQARDYVSKATGTTPADILTDVQTQMRGGPPPPPHGNISGEEPWVQREANRTLSRGVANRYIAERVKGGELEPINPEIGASTEELMARGLKMNPAEVDQHINDLMENAGGNARDQAAAVRKQERYLTQRSRALSLKYETSRSAEDRANYEQARQELNDFHAPGGPIKKMKELFHSHGVGLQGEPSIDLSTYGGLEEKYIKETKAGIPPAPKFRPRLEKVAERVRDTHTAEYKARADLEREANRPSKRKIPDADKVVEDIHKAMNGFPCPM